MSLLVRGLRRLAKCMELRARGMREGAALTPAELECYADRLRRALLPDRERCGAAPPEGTSYPACELRAGHTGDHSADIYAWGVRS